MASDSFHTHVFFHLAHDVTMTKAESNTLTINIHNTHQKEQTYCTGVHTEIDIKNLFVLTSAPNEGNKHQSPI